MKNVILELKEVSKHFAVKSWLRKRRDVIHAVDDVSFEIEKGEVFGLVGESGCGKSTIGKMLLGLHTPTSGYIIFQGKRLDDPKVLGSRWFKRNAQMVFQNPGSSLNPRRSIAQILVGPLIAHNLGSKQERKKKTEEMLELVEIPGSYINRYPASLSGGQKQRVAIARALMLNPAFLVLDEPTSALDVSVQAKVMSLLLKFHRDWDLTYLLISHDLSLVRNIASTVAVIYLGKICEIAGVASLFSAPVHPYTQMLLAAVPVVSAEEEAVKPKTKLLKGDPPSPTRIPPGCRFHPRCPSAQKICRKEAPERSNVSPNHVVYCHEVSSHPGT